VPEHRHLLWHGGRVPHPGDFCLEALTALQHGMDSHTFAHSHWVWAPSLGWEPSSHARGIQEGCCTPMLGLVAAPAGCPVMMSALGQSGRHGTTHCITPKPMMLAMLTVISAFDEQSMTYTWWMTGQKCPPFCTAQCTVGKFLLYELAVMHWSN
jgi:hypothetical protein